MKSDDAKAFVSQLVRRLRDTQAPSGAFVATSYGSSGEVAQRQSPFITGLVLSLAAGHLTPEARSRAVRYLKTQFTHGTVNYWERKSAASLEQPFPDDLDDTAVALSGRIAAGETLSGKEIGAFAAALIGCESAVGGPYRTWVGASGTPWDDIDPAVNANIRKALADMGTAVPALDAYLLDAPLASPYYLGQLPVAFFMARAGIRRGDFSLEPPRNDALGLAMAAFVSGTKPYEALREATDWRGIFIREDDATTAGSEAVALAVCLAALAGHPRNYSKEKKALVGIPVGVRERLEAFVEALPGTLRRVGEARLRTFLSSSHGAEVCTLCEGFAAALSEASRPAQAVTDTLGSATALGWIAYTILDDVYDGDGGIGEIPVALACLREVGRCYASAFTDDDPFLDYFGKVMDGIDEANAWEMEARTVKDPDWGSYVILSRRAFGHALGPLAMLSLAGSGPGTEPFRALERYFSGYLIARQLNDDLHDWQADAAAGLVTAVTSAVDTLSGVNAGKSAQAVLFWETLAPRFAKRIRREVREASSALGEVSQLERPEGLLRAIKAMDTAAEALLAERKRTLELISVVAKR